MAETSLRDSGERPTADADLKESRQRELHHITRIDIEPSEAHPRRHPTHGWQVRARREGKRLSKFFADAKHGGSESALSAAKAYRDHLLSDMPDSPQKPRKAWSNTGVVGLSVREKNEGSKPRLYVQLNWIDATGKRRAASFSVEKWGLRRALWNGCLRLYRERGDAGYPVEEPHVMFARAQEPFAEQIREEQREQARQEAAAEAERKAMEFAASPEGRMKAEEDALKSVENALFGR
ncbi:MAG: AP2 domain-containing protein [Bacteroidota bacterium]